MKKMIFFALLLAWVAGLAQTKSISGYVYYADNTTKMPYTTVFCVGNGTQKIAIASGTGYYQFPALTPGTYKIMCSWTYGTEDPRQRPVYQPTQGDLTYAQQCLAGSKPMPTDPLQLEALKCNRTQANGWGGTWSQESVDALAAKVADPAVPWNFAKCFATYQQVNLESHNITGLDINIIWIGDGDANAYKR